LLSADQGFLDVRSWVAEQSTSHAGELWVDGAKDYVSHAEKLLKVCV
jgi:hypothetical protein